MRKPTVTELVGMLDKPNLLKWANKIGLDGVSLDAHREASKAKGISLHDQVKCFIESARPFEDQTVQDAFVSFQKGKRFYSVEEKIETDWFIGRLDARLSIDGMNYVCDFKSSDQIYFEQKLQLTAYKMAYPDHEIAIVQMPSFAMTTISIDFKKCEIILKCLHKIWELKQQL